LIYDSMKKIGVIGLGYVGLPLALHFAEFDEKVVGFDLDINKVALLSRGRTSIPDVSEKRLQKCIESNNIFFSENPSSLAQCQVIIVCVPTPLNSQKDIDLSALISCVDSIVKYAREGSLIISESTSYPGTLRELFHDRLNIERSGERFYLATAPERVDPGSSFKFKEIARVVGGIDNSSTQLAVDFYSRYFKKVVPVSSPEIAEMSKLLENTFRQVNISLINEINDLCRDVGIDTREVIEAASSKPYGFMKFTPSAGIGGHCIPVDPEYLQYFAKRSGRMIESVRVATEINDSMGELLVKRVEKFLNGKEFSSAIVLGVAYKPNIPDVRDTPVSAIMESLKKRGIKTDWHDPLVATWEGTSSADLQQARWRIGIIVTAHEALNIDHVVDACDFVFDCTGRYSQIPKIVQI
jgi:UDP-N-acetyl-D-glucosamine dehydrogenase